MGRVDHDCLALLDADVDADVGNVARALPEEDEVARLEWRPRRHQRPRVVLLLRCAGQRDPGDPVGGLGEPGAVEANPPGPPRPSGNWTLHRLAGELGHRGLTNRGRRDRPLKAITWQGLAKILANPIHTGVVCWGGVEHAGLHKPLTTSETFRRAQELLAARSVRGTRERKHPHYLKGVLHCGVCGRHLSIQHSKGRYTYFFCLGQKIDPQGTCRERCIAADDLEDQVEQLYASIQLPASWAERLSEELAAEVIERQRADVTQRELLTRRVAKAETARRKLLDAYYGGAIDVPTLKAEQARIGADLTTAKDRLGDLDANLTEWQEILELAATVATRCGDAYRMASERTRRQFNAAVFTRLDVKDGRICHEEYRPPFDDIVSVPEFEYGHRERTTGIEPA